MRRSHAMAPLGRENVDEILAACARYAREHQEIVAILTELRATFPVLRDGLLEMARLTATARDRRQLVLKVEELQRCLPAVRNALNRLMKATASAA